MYPQGVPQVRVPITADANGAVVGANLVARIGQPGIYSYGLVRVTINGPVGEFRLYKGSTTQSPFTTVYSSGVADAQFQPPELIPPGNDLIGVWVGGATYTGIATMIITTDGGM